MGVVTADAKAPSPPPAPDPHNALLLSATMRRRLRGAVRALLRDPCVAGLADAARLAAVVLVAKARARDGTTRIRTGELARWLGVSESTVKHAVLPALRGSRALRSRITSDALGRAEGLECVVMPMWRARSSLSAALALTRPELATLLRLLEALFAPGWGQGTGTPPGLLAGRQGRGAATDRLALLMVVLETRADGWTRLCGGSVTTRRGRAAATVARLLGCSAAGGEQVLRRLRARGLLEVVRADTASGLRGAGRMRVPAVAAAHRKGAQACVGAGQTARAAATVPEPDRPRRGRPGRVGRCADPAGTALGEGARACPGPALVSCPAKERGRMEADPDAGAPLHAPHASTAGLGTVSAGDDLVDSGAAVGGEPTAAGSAYAREEPRSASGETAGHSPPERRPGPGASAMRAGCTRPDPVRRPDPRSGPRAGGDPLLMERRVADVLDAVPELRDRLAASPGRSTVAVAAVKAALATTAAPVLAARLQARFAQLGVPADACSGDAGALRDPLGWLLAALPRVTMCRRCGRTWHGTRTGAALCRACTRAPSAAPCPVGPCWSCGTEGELTSAGLCGRCDTRQAVAAAADRAADAVGGITGTGQSHRPAPPPAERARRRVEQAAAEAAHEAVSRGAHTVTQRAAARLAADLCAARIEEWARRHTPAAAAHRAQQAGFAECADHGCSRRVAVTAAPESGLCTGCEQRRRERDRRANGSRWRQRVPPSPPPRGTGAGTRGLPGSAGDGPWGRLPPVAVAWAELGPGVPSEPPQVPRTVRAGPMARRP